MQRTYVFTVFAFFWQCYLAYKVNETVLPKPWIYLPTVLQYKCAIVSIKFGILLDVTAKQTLVIRTSKMNRPRELFVSGLPYHLSNEKLSSYFASFGPISKFTRPPDRRTGRNGSFAFLSYRDISIFECKSARFLCFQGLCRELLLENTLLLGNRLISRLYSTKITLL